MGIDVNLYVEVDPTPEALADAEQFFRSRSSFGDAYGDDPRALVPTHEEWHARPRVEVRTFSRYYGPGYEHGDWPSIYGGIRVLQAAFPEGRVFYGGDTDDVGVECTQEYMEEIWEHFLGEHGDDYRRRRRP